MDENSYILDVKDYDDINLIVTKNKIFSRLYPHYIRIIDNYFLNISVIATYDSENIIEGCTNNSLLSLVDLNSLEENISLSYSDLNINFFIYACSISFLEPYAYLVYLDLDNSNTSAVRHFSMHFLKYSFKDKNYIHFVQPNFLDPNQDIVYKICEAIQILDNQNDSTLVCGYSTIYFNRNNYYYVLLLLDFQLKQVIDKIDIYQSEKNEFFELQRINTTYIRLILGNNSSAIYITRNNNNNLCTINLKNEGSRNEYLFGELFYYNNKNIFHSALANETSLNYNLYISNNFTSNYLITIIQNKSFEKIAGFYDKRNNIFMYAY